MYKQRKLIYCDIIKEQSKQTYVNLKQGQRNNKLTPHGWQCHTGTTTHKWWCQQPNGQRQCSLQNSGFVDAYCMKQKTGLVHWWSEWWMRLVPMALPFSTDASRAPIMLNRSLQLSNGSDGHILTMPSLKDSRGSRVARHANTDKLIELARTHRLWHTWLSLKDEGRVHGLTLTTIDETRHDTHFHTIHQSKPTLSLSFNPHSTRPGLRL